MGNLKKISQSIDDTNRKLGKSVSWLALIMVIFMAASVVQRYLFASNFIWQQELILFMHSIVFLAAASYTLLDNEHVRVDILYERLGERKKAIIELVGTIIFLMPVCIALIYFSFDFIINSWDILEGSRENDGLPGVFLLKTLIWVFAGTLILQGTSNIFRSILTLKK